MLYQIPKYIFGQCKVADLANRVKKISNISNRATTNFFKNQVEPNLLLLVSIYFNWCFGVYIFHYLSM